jgi:hypothetical protein
VLSVEGCVLCVECRVLDVVCWMLDGVGEAEDADESGYDIGIHGT